MKIRFLNIISATKEIKLIATCDGQLILEQDIFNIENTSITLSFFQQGYYIVNIYESKNIAIVLLSSQTFTI